MFSMHMTYAVYIVLANSVSHSIIFDSTVPLEQSFNYCDSTSNSALELSIIFIQLYLTTVPQILLPRLRLLGG